METRFVTVPPPITVTDERAGVTVSREFQRLVQELTRDPQFGATLDGVLAALEIRTAFVGKPPGAVVPVVLATWERLCKALREPTHGVDVEIMIQVLPHARAIIDAPSTPPPGAET